MIGRVTRILLSVCLAALPIWATIAAIWGRPGDTISETIRDYAAQYPILSLAAGVLIGHWFWHMGAPVPRDNVPPPGGAS